MPSMNMANIGLKFKFYPLGQTFTPASLPGLQLWLKADAQVYSDLGTTPAVNNGTIEQWNDQSGNGYNATQTTSANRPTYLTNLLNSLPGVKLPNAAGLGMSVSSSLNIVGPFTLITLEQPLETIQNGIRTLQSIANNCVLSVGRNGTANAFCQGDISDFNPGDTNVHSAVITVGSAGASPKYYVDGVDHTNVSPTANGTWGQLGIGGTGFITSNGDCYLYEVISYNVVLNTSQIASIRQYFQGKWGAG